MKVIHLLRKPLGKGTVASNTLKHGVGGLNIDGCRIHGGVSTGGVSSGENAFGQDAGWNKTNVYRQEIDRSMPQGRWPANLILQHLDGCKRGGVVRIRTSSNPTGVARGKSVDNAGATGSATFTSSSVPSTDFTGKDGKEDIMVWECGEGCPVASMSATAARSAGHYPTTYSNSGGYGGALGKGCQGPLYSDTGGASRFFKQVGGSKE